MAEPIFKSGLTLEEIEHNFQGANFFAGIMEGLEEALAFEKGAASPETFETERRHLP